jgi:hypothetical protein
MSKLSTSNDYRILTWNYGDLCIYPIWANTDDLEISITSWTKDLCLSVAIRIFDSICWWSNNRYTHEAIKILRASIDSNKNKLKTRPFIRNATINLEEWGLTVNYDEIKKIIELQLYQLLDLNPWYNTSCKKASIKFSLDKTKCSDSDEIIIHTSRAVFRALVNLQYAIKKDSKK